MEKSVKMRVLEELKPFVDPFTYDKVKAFLQKAKVVLYNKSVFIYTTDGDMVDNVIYGMIGFTKCGDRIQQSIKKHTGAEYVGFSVVTDVRPYVKGAVVVE